MSPLKLTVHLKGLERVQWVVGWLPYTWPTWVRSLALHVVLSLRGVILSLEPGGSLEHCWVWPKQNTI